MKLSKPSPALVVSVVAMVVAMTGAGVAAINATSVDGLSAVKSGSSKAAGRLVATESKGNGKGTIPARYLNPGTTFGRAFEVPDNQVLAPVTIGGIEGLGTLTASCYDQNSVAGNEDPATRVIFVNTSGAPVNFSRTLGNAAPSIGLVQNGAQAEFTITGSNTFEMHIQKSNVNYLAQGVIRQDGRGTPTGSCVVYGFAITVR